MEFAATVIVPTRGGINRLPRLVGALSRQSRSDFETIFVVDGDIDGSTEYLDSRDVKDTLTNAKIISFSENRGRSEALNAGHNNALGEVLIRCDDDLEPAEDYIDAHVSRQNQGPQGTIGLYRNVFPETPYAKAYGRDSDLKFEETALKTMKDLQWRYWAGNVSIHRRIWDAVGPYDARFRTYGWEDVDYGYRVYKAGYPVVIAEELSTKHHVAAVTTEIRALRALHSGAARETFELAHGKNALPEATGSSTWDKLVDLVSNVSTEKSIGFAGTAIDSILPYIPKTVGTKLVAMLVEGAGQAGIKYPDRAKSNF